MSILSNNADNYPNGVRWSIVFFYLFNHVAGVLLCILFPSWEGVIAFLILYILTGLGVTVGFHRKIAHQSFSSPRWIEYFLALLGTLAAEGPPHIWIAKHRQHHVFTDKEGDPHSPQDGHWWAHWIWMTPLANKEASTRSFQKWAPELYSNPFYRFIAKHYFSIQIAALLTLFVIGYQIGSIYLGMSLLGYGGFLRIAMVYHATGLVNSLSHSSGYRNYATNDNSHNNPLVSIISLGEGWHNNHHKYQGAANHGQRWWEFDMSFIFILLLAIFSWPLKLIGLKHLRLAHSVRYYSFNRRRMHVIFK